jgi:hypothetical protein
MAIPPKLLLTAFLSSALIFNFSNANAATVGYGQHGESISVNKTTGVLNNDLIEVTGKNFDPTVGIYVAMCKVVPAGNLPTPCGGGADKTGKLQASYWISSNPPPYGRGLAIPFKNNGFDVKLKVSNLIGNLDCRKIACAIYVRADHTRTDDRSHDIKVPLHFK